jgi:hypothetical protein
MSGLRSLKQFRQQQQERASFSGERKKIPYLAVGANESVRIRFAQELDEESENYDPKRGLAILAVEHNGTGPEGYKKRAKCTADDGPCYPCERHRQDPKAGWRQKTNLYINVLVEQDGEVVAKVWSRNANSDVVGQLIEWFEENGSVTNVAFKLTRTGKTVQDTRYTLTPIMNKDVLTKFDLDGVELINLKDVLIEKSYDEQPAWFGSVVESPAEAAPKATVADDDDAW